VRRHPVALTAFLCSRTHQRLPAPIGWPAPGSRSASASLSCQSATARHSAHAFSGQTASAAACRHRPRTRI